MSFYTYEVSVHIFNSRSIDVIKELNHIILCVTEMTVFPL